MEPAARLSMMVGEDRYLSATIHYDVKRIGQVFKN